MIGQGVSDLQLRGQFWPIAIDRPTRPYNIASTTVQQVIQGFRESHKSKMTSEIEQGIVSYNCYSGPLTLTFLKTYGGFISRKRASQL
jgi:hypothetical protein